MGRAGAPAHPHPKLRPARARTRPAQRAGTRTQSPTSNLAAIERSLEKKPGCRCLTNPASVAGDKPRTTEFYGPLIAIGDQPHAERGAEPVSCKRWLGGPVSTPRYAGHGSGVVSASRVFCPQPTFQSPFRFVTISIFRLRMTLSGARSSPVKVL